VLTQYSIFAIASQASASIDKNNPSSKAWTSLRNRVLVIQRESGNSLVWTILQWQTSHRESTDKIGKSLHLHKSQQDKRSGKPQHMKPKLAILLALAFLLPACGVGTPTPVTPTPTVTQPPTDIPTQTALPTLAIPPSPTVAPPYPTASVTKANAVAFIAENSLWIANVDGSGERKLTDIEDNAFGGSSYLLQWSPDGKSIGYISGDDLWVIFPDGLAKKKILSFQNTDQKIIRTYAWSPDSSKIAYAQTADWSDRPLISLRIIDLETGIISVLSFPQTFFAMVKFTLSWSPNGQYLLLSRERAFTIFDVATHKILKEIMSYELCPIWHHGPVWSPNNKWFYHPIYASGIYNMSICVSGVDGSSKYIYGSSSSRLPVWDKTGNFLYFTTQDTKQRLLQYDVRTQETKIMLVLEASESSKWSVSISPDGHILEMDGTISGNQQLFIFLNLDSLSATRFKIPEIPSDIISFNTTYWSADNQNLIFLSGEFYRLNSQTGKTTVFSGKHSVESWAISPIATTP
jgi:Tol biopolymer transport system component